VLLDLGIDELTSVGFEAIERAFLVRSHQPRVARHIGGKDRGETALDGFSHGLPQRCRYTTIEAGEMPRADCAQIGLAAGVPRIKILIASREVCRWVPHSC
jgi:hypothetical protein